MPDRDLDRALRVLDRKVAEALGHKVWFWTERLPDGTERSLELYSTAFGPWTQVMWDWLEPRVLWLHFPERGSHTIGKVWMMRVTMPDVDQAVHADGATLPEALARLVVAVAEKERQDA